MDSGRSSALSGLTYVPTQTRRWYLYLESFSHQHSWFSFFLRYITSPRSFPKSPTFLLWGNQRLLEKKRKITVLGRLLTSHICSLPQGQPPSHSFPLVSDTSLHSPPEPSLVPALQTSHPLDYLGPPFPSTSFCAHPYLLPLSFKGHILTLLPDQPLPFLPLWMPLFHQVPSWNLYFQAFIHHWFFFHNP